MRYQLFHRRIIIELIDILTIVIEPTPPASTLLEQGSPLATTDHLPDAASQLGQVDDADVQASDTPTGK